MQSIHECCCAFPKKLGLELLEPVHSICEQKEKDIKVYRQIVDMLSVERVAFVGMFSGCLLIVVHSSVIILAI